MTANFTYKPGHGGVFAPNFNLVPYPTPIMRRQALYDVLMSVHAIPQRVSPVTNTDCEIPPLNKRYIEIGYGTGIFAYEFYRMGFDVSGYDLSESAYNIAQKLFNSDKHRLTLKKELVSEDKARYHILGAYEVLEHIADDAKALHKWRELLCEDGMLLLSVPAHMKSFGIRDQWAGHVKRYEKNGLRMLLEQSGYKVIRLISYGFPLPKLLNKATEIFVDKPHLKRLEQEQTDESHKTFVSGIERAEEYKFRKILPYRFLVLFSKVQRLFYNSDLGLGYIVAARKAN